MSKELYPSDLVDNLIAAAERVEWTPMICLTPELMTLLRIALQPLQTVRNRRMDDGKRLYELVMQELRGDHDTWEDYPKDGKRAFCDIAARFLTGREDEQ